MLGFGVSGHLVTSGLQDSGLLAEQPASEAAEPLEEKILTHCKHKKTENKEIMIRYYKSNKKRISEKGSTSSEKNNIRIRNNRTAASRSASIYNMK